MTSSAFSNPALWATLACAAVALVVIFERSVDLAKFMREPGIESLSGAILVLLTTVAVVLMALAFLVSS
jgi:hypothetical protein